MCSTWLCYETEFRSYCLQTIPLTGLCFFWSQWFGVTEVSLHVLWEDFSSCCSGLREICKCLYCVFFFWLLLLISVKFGRRNRPKIKWLKKIEQLISLSTSAEVDSSELVLWLCPQTPQRFRFWCFHIRLWKLNFNQDGYSRRIQHICIPINRKEVRKRQTYVPSVL